MIHLFEFIKFVNLRRGSYIGYGRVIHQDVSLKYFVTILSNSSIYSFSVPFEMESSYGSKGFFP